MVEAAFFEKALVLLAYIIGIIGTVWSINRQRKNDKKEYDSAFAKKEEVNKDFKIMEKRIDVVEKIIESNRKDNIVAHQEIKGDIEKHIDTRFEDIKELIRTLKSA